MTYNLYKGAIGRERDLLALVQSVQPDLLFLEEVAGEQSIRQLAEALGMGYTFARSHYGPKNLALLSRYPLVASDTYLAFPLFHSLLLATIELPSGDLLNLYGVHLGVLHDWWRTVEVRAILRRIQQYEALHPTPYALMAGDFNAILPRDRVNLRIGTRLHKVILFLEYAVATRLAPRLLERADWVDGYRVCHPNSDGFTFPSTALAVRLDHIFVTPALVPQLRECTVVTESALTKTVSDHLPLVAQFEMEHQFPKER
jgi:endonuclease/exonuclease/phosphatase family metal-dependent hydrolase